MLGDTDDFRDHAAQASRTIVAASARRDPLLAGSSLCLQVFDEGGQARRYSSGCLPRFLICLFLLIAGIVVSLMSIRSGQPPAMDFLIPGIALASGSVLLGLLIMAMEPGRRRRALFDPSRPGKPLFDPAMFKKTYPVGIEDMATYNKLKLIGDDIGIMVLDAEHGRALIEGDAYRYVIRGEDVTGIKVMPSHGSLAAGLEFRIGKQVLKITLTDVSLAAAISANDKRTGGQRMRELLEETFGWSEEIEED